MFNIYLQDISFKNTYVDTDNYLETCCDLAASFAAFRSFFLNFSSFLRHCEGKQALMLSQYLHLNETLKGLLCQELIFPPKIMTLAVRNADEFIQRSNIFSDGEQKC